MRKKLIVIFVIVVLAGLSVYAYKESHSQPAGAASGPGGGGGRRGGGQGGGQAIPVSVATAKSEDVPVYLDGLGSV